VPLFLLWSPVGQYQFFQELLASQVLLCCLSVQQVLVDLNQNSIKYIYLVGLEFHLVLENRGNPVHLEVQVVQENLGCPCHLEGQEHQILVAQDLLSHQGCLEILGEVLQELHQILPVLGSQGFLGSQAHLWHLAVQGLHQLLVFQGFLEVQIHLINQHLVNLGGQGRPEAPFLLEVLVVQIREALEALVLQQFQEDLDPHPGRPGTPSFPGEPSKPGSPGGPGKPGFPFSPFIRGKPIIEKKDVREISSEGRNISDYIRSSTVGKDALSYLGCLANQEGPRGQDNHDLLCFQDILLILCYPLVPLLYRCPVLESPEVAQGARKNVI
ncbi:hypothetical protein E2320_012917, partial [Naja naja]